MPTPSPIHSPTIRPTSASCESEPPEEDAVSRCGATVDAGVGKAVGMVGEKVDVTVGEAVGVVGEKVGAAQQPSKQHTAPWTQQLPEQQTSPAGQQPLSQQVLPSEQAVSLSQQTSLTPSKQPDAQQVAVSGAAPQQGFSLLSQQLLVLLEQTVVPQVTACSSLLLLLTKNPYGFDLISRNFFCLDPCLILL